ncbi:MAG TPA: hypothetical protein VGR87_02510 [Candidatus Limnocylindria bacterium]|jgi:hypothetical protein|nr:hypothetical protein [Candidatus Limnocylindria bacterium]
MDAQARQQRQQVMTAYGTVGALGWLVGAIYVWFAGFTGGSFLVFLIVGAILSLLLVGALTYTVSIGIGRASRALRWSPSIVDRAGMLLIVLAFLAGAALAIALQGTLF